MEAGKKGDDLTVLSQKTMKFPVGYRQFKDESGIQYSIFGVQAQDKDNKY